LLGLKTHGSGFIACPVCKGLEVKGIVGANRPGRGKRVEFRMEEQECVQSFKHVCKICKRRFACGRALGGHMRIHGSTVAASSDFNEGFSETGAKPALVPNSGKQEQEASSGVDLQQQLNNGPMYDLRPNRKRNWSYADLEHSFDFPYEFGSKMLPSTSLKNLQLCEYCGEEFFSWKTLIRHMRCHYNNPTKGEQHGVSEDKEDVSNSESDSDSNPQWNKTKGKRSKRPRHHRPNSEEAAAAAAPATTAASENEEVEYMANCLVMLATAGEPWESKNRQFYQQCATSGSVDVKTPIVLKTHKRKAPSGKPQSQLQPVKLTSKKMGSTFQCRSCKKIFDSFHALGGHRASHNKIKGCFAREEAESLEGEEIITTDEDLSKDMHKTPPSKDQLTDSCSNGIEEVHGGLKPFESGQALSGHMGIISSETTSDISSTKQQQHPPWLDLNLPAPLDDDANDEFPLPATNSLLGNIY